jgi:general secretion pathway protein B
MSFILDALKKAESERHLGELPGIHSQNQIPGLVVKNAGNSQGRRTMLAVAVSIVVLGAIGLVWLTLPSAPAPVALTGTPAAPVQSAQPARPQAMPVPAPAAVQVAGVAAEPAPIAVATALSTPPAMPKPVVAVKKDKDPLAAMARSAAPSAVPPVSAAAKQAPVAVEPANVIALAQLPPALRGELPVLAIGGSIYSANPVDRMLLMDKRMLREGDEISPGLVLETILPKGANLRYKGYVFRITF